MLIIGPVPKSRAEAKRLSSKYYLGRECSHNHGGVRLVSNCHCVVCNLINSTAWSLENPEASARIKKTWKKNNREKARLSNRVSARRQRQKDPIPPRKQCQRWHRNNRGAVNALKAKRRAREMKATPNWGKDCHPIYDFARQLVLLTGWKWHVDHILPLQGKNVCGLHVPENLQILPASLNQMKHNKLVTRTATPPA